MPRWLPRLIKEGYEWYKHDDSNLQINVHLNVKENDNI